MVNNLLKRANTKNQNVISIQGLTKSFNSHRVIKSLALQVPKNLDAPELGERNRHNHKYRR